MLVLSQTNVTEVGIEAVIVGCPLLNELALDGCENVSDAATEMLSTHGCKSLTIIDMNECDVSDAGIAALAAGCPDLAEVREREGGAPRLPPPLTRLLLRDRCIFGVVREYPTLAWSTSL